MRIAFDGPFVLALLVAFSGCSSESSNLPKPRPPEPEVEAVVQAAPPMAHVPGQPSQPVAGNPPTSTTVGTPVPQQPVVAGTTPPAPPATGGTTPAPTPSSNPNNLDQRTQAIQRLQAISSVLDQYRKAKGRYPDPTLGKGLSWRVELLPFVGEEVLYKKFKLNEPWDSEHNKALLTSIPEIYRSPFRNDEKTNFQFITGVGTAFPKGKGALSSDFADGLANTAILAEVSDELAQPWTKPADYVFRMETAQTDLFRLRTDVCFLVMGENGCRQVPAFISDEQLSAILSPAGKETIPINQVVMPANPNLDQEILDELKLRPIQRKPVLRINVAAISADDEPRSGVANEVTNNAPLNTPSTTDPQGATTNDNRFPIPNDFEITSAHNIVKDLFQAEYQSARTAADKREFGKRLWAQAGKVTADRAGSYVLLCETRDFASRGGDLATALLAIDKLNAMFRIEPIPMYLKAVETGYAQMDAPQAGPVYRKLLDITNELVDRDDFDNAKRALTMAGNLASRHGNPQAVGFVTSRKEMLEEMRKSFEKITSSVHNLLLSPDDPGANRAVGRYLCFIKRNWKKGLPMLAKGDDETLQQLAAADLRNPVAAEDKMVIGDRWWDAAEKFTGTEQRNVRLRAGHWYLLAQPTMPPSLAKERAARRVLETGATLDPETKKTLAPAVSSDE